MSSTTDQRASLGVPGLAHRTLSRCLTLLWLLEHHRVALSAFTKSAGAVFQAVNTAIRPRRRRLQLRRLQRRRRLMVALRIQHADFFVAPATVAQPTQLRLTLPTLAADAPRSFAHVNSFTAS